MTKLIGLKYQSSLLIVVIILLFDEERGASLAMEAGGINWLCSLTGINHYVQIYPMGRFITP